jgi:hypothetical protein
MSFMQFDKDKEKIYEERIAAALATDEGKKLLAKAMVEPIKLALDLEKKKREEEMRQYIQDHLVKDISMEEYIEVLFGEKCH